MPVALELLAPARNKDIGIAAIDCGADAVYIAGPAFGAREAAGNSFTDIAELTAYARRFGAKVFLTLNTLVYEQELEAARQTVFQAVEAGVEIYPFRARISALGVDLGEQLPLRPGPTT